MSSRFVTAAERWSRAVPIGPEFEGSPCLVLPNKPGKNGYVQVSQRRKKIQAHRLLFEAMSGPIPGGMEPDHRCRRRACVTYWHIEPVAHAENVRRGTSPCATNANAQRCRAGHELTDGNVYAGQLGRRRRCRICHRARQRAYHSRKTHA